MAPQGNAPTGILTQDFLVFLGDLRFRGFFSHISAIGSNPACHGFVRAAGRHISAEKNDKPKRARLGLAAGPGVSKRALFGLCVPCRAEVKTVHGSQLA